MYLSCQIIFSILCISLMQAQSRITKKITYGPFNIGYRIDHVYDKSRSYFPKYDYYGNKTNHPTGRPMQISIWYPTESIKDLEKMQYKDYLGYSSSEIHFEKSSKTDQNKIITSYLERINQPYRDKLSQLYDEKINVYKDAEFILKDFPIILFSPPNNTSAYDNNIINEYLASHGYIVLSVAAKGEYSQLQKNTVRSMHVQAEDLAFLLQYGRTLTKSHKVGAIGFSRGGLANLIFAMKNKDIDATISLDGSIFSLGWLNDIKKSDYYDPEAFTSNILMITKNMNDPIQNPAIFYDSLRYANKTLIRFDHNNHGYFSSNNLLEQLLFNDQMSDEKKDSLYHFYTEMTEYVAEFLDYYLKNGTAFTVHLKKAYSHNFKSEKGLRKPIESDAIPDLIINKGFDYVLSILNDIQKIDPFYIKNLDWRNLNNTADQLETDGRLIDAIQTLKLSNKTFSNWYQTHFKLASFYEKENNPQMAITHYKIALNDHPRHKESLNALKRLNVNVIDYHKTSLTDKALKTYLGRYKINEEHYRDIFIENGNLYIYSNYWKKPLKMWPLTKTKFLIEENDPQYNMQILFKFDKKNTLNSLMTRGLNSGRIGQENIKIR